MNNTQPTPLFIINPSKDAEFLVLPETQQRYPELIASILTLQLRNRQDWEVLGRTLVKLCRSAHAARQMPLVREISSVLVSQPFRAEVRAIGTYYQAQILHQKGRFEAARIIFEQLTNNPRFTWKARALADIGACHFDSGNPDEAAIFYSDSHRTSLTGPGDVVALLHSQWMIAIIQSFHGDHNDALKSLESLYPLVQYVARARPSIYYNYLNSLAVRHIALNHFDEAAQLCNIFLSSPFTPNFKGWSDTRNELREAKEAVAATVFVNIEQSLQRPSRVEPCTVETATSVLSKSNSDIAFDEPLAPAVQVQENNEHSVDREPERRRITIFLIAMRSDGAEVIAARLIRAKAAVAASRDGVSKPFAFPIKPRAPPACISNRQN